MRRLFGLLVLPALLGCARVPYTNRSQLLLLSTAEENRLGAEAYQQVLAESRLDKNERVVGEVETVGRRIAQVADRPDFQWRFVVIDDAKQVNAFCLPGGKVAVYAGILPVAQTTTGLAVVLGHEIAHALARHGAERMSQGMVVQAGGAVLGGFLGGGPSASAIMAAYGLGSQVGVLLPYGRAQESEADHIGLILMARAGYDPRAAIAFWQRMERSGGGGTPEFLSTHPSHGTREEQIREWLPEVLPLYEAAAPAPDVPLVARAPTSAAHASGFSSIARGVSGA